MTLPCLVGRVEEQGTASFSVAVACLYLRREQSIFIVEEWCLATCGWWVVLFSLFGNRSQNHFSRLWEHCWCFFFVGEGRALGGIDAAGSGKYI